MGGSGYEIIGGVKETLDGGYIVAGSSESSNGDLTDNYGLYDAWLIKLNALGAVEWQKNYGGSDLDSFRDIQVLADGSFIVLGNTSSTDGDVTGMNGIRDVWLVNVDATGTLLWQATYGGSEEDLAGRMVLTTDDHLVVCGVSRSNDGDVSNNHGAEDVWVFKVDLEGNMIWERSFGGSGEDRGIRVVQVTDQQFVICGFTRSSDEDVSFNNGFIDAWVFKLNSAGELLWEHALGGSDLDQLITCFELPNEDLLMVGRTRSTDGDVAFNHGATDVWLVRTDAFGEIIWERTYGGSADEGGGSFHWKPSGNCVVAATSYSNDGDVSGNHGFSDVWIFELEADQTGIPETGKATDLKIYPNPTSGSLMVGFQLEVPSLVGYSWFHSNGALITEHRSVAMAAGYHMINLSEQGLPAGAYQLVLIMDGQRIVREVVKL